MEREKRGRELDGYVERERERESLGETKKSEDVNFEIF